MVDNEIYKKPNLVYTHSRRRGFDSVVAMVFFNARKPYSLSIKFLSRQICP